MTLLPPNSTPFERALEESVSAIADLPVEIAKLWDPATCPAQFLPWLAWGLSIDFWDAAWTEQEKREAIAGTIEAQRRKGTRASLRAVLDRYDPLIAIVEWFEDRDHLDPHTFRLELPLATVSAVEYDTALVAALLRDIAMVKPLRSHMFAVHRMRAQAYAALLNAGRAAGHVRLDSEADVLAAQDPVWNTYLQSENGEPFVDENGGGFLVHS